MSHRILALVAVLSWCLAAPALASTEASSCDSGNVFVTHLTGAEEVPPVDTKAQGQVLFRLNKDGDELSFMLNVAGLENIIQAHIHCGPAGVNGSVTVFLFGPEAGGVDVTGRLSDGTITNDNVLPIADSATCPGGIADLDDLLAQIRAGNTYVNVHTVAHPPGEVRGQLEAPGSE
jgi:hypothetical protein